MLLNDVFPELKVEDKNLECKARLNRDDSLGFLKTVGGFANASGGTIVLGVEDKTNTLIGYDLVDIDKEKLYFYKEIKEHFVTTPDIDSNVYEYLVHDKKRYIIVFHVAESEVKPVIVKMKGAPLVFVRRDGFTNYATVEELVNMAKYNANPKYDLDKTDKLFDFDDFKKLREFYFDNVGKDLKIKDLESINFYDDNKHLFKGSNLFSDDYDGKDLKAVFSIYKGFTRGDDTIISSVEYKGNAIDCCKFIIENVDLKMNHGLIKKDTYHVDLDSFPKRSLFEAVINSIAHKDYYIDGSAIYVDMFKDRLSITSPGCPYGRKELQKTYNLDSFASKRRNELISNIFVLCNAMEAKGTGFEKIMDDYKNADIKHKPFIYSKNNSFTIVLPDLTFSDGVNVDAESIKLLASINNPTRFDVSILAYCYGEKRSVKDMASYLNVANSTFLRKDVIQNLLSQAFLIESKQSNKAVFTTNKEKVALL